MGEKENQFSPISRQLGLEITGVQKQEKGQKVSRNKRTSVYNTIIPQLLTPCFLTANATWGLDQQLEQLALKMAENYQHTKDDGSDNLQKY